MKKLFQNRWFKIGLWLALIGWSPLWLTVLLSEMGLLSDPNPNPVGFGILFFLTFWPAVILMAIGGFQVVRGRK